MRLFWVTNLLKTQSFVVIVIPLYLINCNGYNCRGASWSTPPPNLLFSIKLSINRFNTLWFTKLRSPPMKWTQIQTVNQLMPSLVSENDTWLFPCSIKLYTLVLSSSSLQRSCSLKRGGYRKIKKRRPGPKICCSQPILCPVCLVQ